MIHSHQQQQPAGPAETRATEPPQLVRCPLCRTMDLAGPRTEIWCYCRRGGTLMRRVTP